MDPEKETRRKLMESLKNHFICYEEVQLRPALFPKHVIRCDVLAIPLNPVFASMTFAFEAKKPVKPDDTSFWKRAIRQAADYVYATVDYKLGLEEIKGRRIGSSFIYPYILPTGKNEPLIGGYFELASYFRVGRVSRDSKNRLSMWVGNEVWRSDVGFTKPARGVLAGKRQLGSRKVDILSEFDGMGRPTDESAETFLDWDDID